METTVKYYSDINLRDGIWETNFNEIKYVVEKKRTNTYFFNVLNSKDYKSTNGIVNNLPEVSFEKVIEFLNFKIKELDSDFNRKLSEINGIMDIDEDIKNIKKFIKKIEKLEKEK